MPNLVIFSGAGLSAESGLGTFRDSEGLWAKHDPMEVCNYNNWIQNFDLVHNFYNLRREELGRVAPNAMHDFLAALPDRLDSKKRGIEIVHLTQNVDDLLERAGVEGAMHLHGELGKLVCPSCKSLTHIGYSAFDKRPCVACGYEYLKPFVVFFFEPAPRYNDLYAVFGRLTKRDCVLVLGTSGAVVDVASLLSIARAKGAPGLALLNNLEPSAQIPESIFDKVFYLPATKAIEPLFDEMDRFFG